MKFREIQKGIEMKFKRRFGTNLEKGLRGDSKWRLEKNSKEI